MLNRHETLAVESVSPITISRSSREQLYPAGIIRTTLGKWLAMFTQIDCFLLLALIIDLLTPILISKHILPNQVRYVSQGALAMIAVVAYARMMVHNRVPSLLWLIAGITVMGFAVAQLEGQYWGATAWGWWERFEFVFAALYVYLSPRWSKDLPKRFFQFCIGLQTVQFMLQLLQYATGETVGDNLAGTFGAHGVGHLFLFSAFVVTLTFGHWRTHGNTLLLIYVLGIGTISNVLGENKFFPIALVAIAGLVMLRNTFRSGQLWKLIVYSVLIFGLFVVFAAAYNALAPTADRNPLQEFILDPDSRDKYLNTVRESWDNGQDVYYLGRNATVQYGWETITDGGLVNILFGFGLGSRTESTTLGLEGVAFTKGNYRANTGTALLVVMQEMGLVGVVTLLSFYGWLAWTLAKQLKERPDSTANTMRYGLILFTLLWPLWMWYHNVWELRVTMWLYWFSVGYVFYDYYQRATPRLRRKAAVAPSLATR